MSEYTTTIERMYWIAAKLHKKTETVKTFAQVGEVWFTKEKRPEKALALEAMIVLSVRNLNKLILSGMIKTCNENDPESNKISV